jgi:dolichol-phosphate mannosyltransferase
VQTFKHATLRINAPKVLVVLPAYNEERGIGKLVAGLSEALTHARFRYELLAVNDGSTDDTLTVLQRYRSAIKGLSIINHERNAGLGATIRDGLFAAAESACDDDIIVTMDADETHSPALLLRMVALIREGYDVVIASRYQPGARVVGLSVFRRLLSAGASSLLRILFPTAGVRDYTCGYRAYRASILKQAIASHGTAFVDQDGFQCMVDILLKLRNQRCVFGEVPIVLRYDRKQGQSKMHVARTVGATLRLIAQRWLGR